MKLKAIETTSRIFPPQSCLFVDKEDRNLSDHKINFNTLNSFKPKLEMKSIKDMSNGKMKKKQLKHRQVDISAIRPKNHYQMKQIDRMIES